MGCAISIHSLDSRERFWYGREERTVREARRGRDDVGAHMSRGTDRSRDDVGTSLGREERTGLTTTIRLGARRVYKHLDPLWCAGLEAGPELGPELQQLLQPPDTNNSGSSRPSGRGGSQRRSGGGSTRNHHPAEVAYWQLSTTTTGEAHGQDPCSCSKPETRAGGSFPGGGFLDFPGGRSGGEVLGRGPGERPWGEALGRRPREKS